MTPSVHVSEADSRCSVGGPTTATELSPIESGARVQRPRRAAPTDAVRPTRAEIDLGALRHNLHALRRAVRSPGALSANGPGPSIFAVLKADAYGHGAPAAARTLERAGVDGLAVALLEEAIELRDAGLRTPILVMGGYYGQAEDDVLGHDLWPVVYHAEHFASLAVAARRRLGAQTGDAGCGCPSKTDAGVKVHLKIDTGMSRLGVRTVDLPALLDRIRPLCRGQGGPIVIDGVMTHFSSADVPGPEGLASVAEQVRDFEAALAIIRAAGHAPTFVHAANSAACLRVDPSGRPLGRVGNAVRPGIALYGFSPVVDADRPATEGPRLLPTLRLRTEVVSLRQVPAGTPVGYSATHRTSRPSCLATVPVGYADGLARRLGNEGFMLVRGRRVPIVGVLSMDLATLDVTDVPGVSLRDEVVALGNQRGPLGEDSIGLGEVAERSGLIPWDVMTSISRRVPRFYREP